MDPTDLAAAFYALEAHREDSRSVTIADLFAEDPKRFDDFHVELDDILFDFSKQRISRQTLALLVDLARAAKVEERRAALFAGEIVNPTEGRPALHMALRNLEATPMFANGHDVMPEVVAERQKMLRFAEDIRNGAIKARMAKPSPISSISASAAPTSVPPWRPRR